MLSIYWLVFSLVFLWSGGALGAAPFDANAAYKSATAAYAKKEYKQAATALADILQQTPAKEVVVLEPVYYMLGVAHFAAKQNREAAGAFQDYLKRYPQGGMVGEARLGLARAWLGEGKLAEVLKLEREVTLSAGPEVAVYDDYPAWRRLRLQLSDRLGDEQRREEALAVLQRTGSRAELGAAQTRQLTALGESYVRASLAAAARPGDALLAQQSRRWLERLGVARAALEVIRQDATFDLPVCTRQGRLLLQLNQPWAAVTVFNEALTVAAGTEQEPRALYGLILAWDAAGRATRAIELCQDYAARFPTDLRVTEVRMLAGKLALKSNRPADAVRLFSEVEAPLQDRVLRGQILYLLAGAKFAARDWAGARLSYSSYGLQYPRGEYAAEALYYLGLSELLAGDYKEAARDLRLFLSRHARHPLEPEAQYRLGSCLLAQKDYANALSVTQSWLLQFKGHPLSKDVSALAGEVHALQADAFRGLNRDADAILSFWEAARFAQTDATRNFALGETVRMLEAGRDWTRAAAVYSEFLASHPDNAQRLAWAYGLARIRARQRDVEGALQALRAPLAAAFADPQNDVVENCLQLIARLQFRRVASAQKEQRALPQTLEQQLGLGTVLPDTLISARLKFYDYALDVWGRKTDAAEKRLLQIGRSFEVTVLSAPLAALAGEALQRGGESKRAEAFFKAVLTRYPKSEWRDVAYVGLGQLALTANDPAAALVQFKAATDEAGGLNRQREALLGQARCLFQLGRGKEAEGLYLQVASERAWRGESTAESLYQLGVIAQQAGDETKAINFYQRVFLGYGRYPRWSAAAYLASARAFEKLGKREEAMNTYKEMLASERLKSRPEATEANKELARLSRAKT